jgi:hypothetical protein
MKKRILCWSSLVLSLVLLACSHSDDVTVATPYPILFVTQVPPETDDGTRLSAFANHRAGVDLSPRGGDLMLRGVDGTLRNLTREAGFGSDGWQGAHSIAVREPAVHWGGDKAVFSMVVGAPVVAGQAQERAWQLYEVRGFGIGEKASITRIANQPERYNNLSPVYASDDRILFTSDRPHNGQAHLYPALDEYEAMPTTSGLWALEPTTGTLTLLSHAPSGAFNPLVDSYGRIIFTRWDHLQQDRLAERDRNAQGNGVAIPFGSFNYAGEHPEASQLNSRAEWFPESGAGSESPYGRVSAFSSNFFTAWQINQDGTGEETINHVGQHELAFGFLTPSFVEDANLSNRTLDHLHANAVSIRREGGLFHLREDPLQPGIFFATSARESESFTNRPSGPAHGLPGASRRADGRHRRHPG